MGAVTIVKQAPIYLNTNVCTAATSNKTNSLCECGPQGKIKEFTTDEANTLTISMDTQAVEDRRAAHSPKAKASLDCLKRQTSVAQTAFLIICSQTH